VTILDYSPGRFTGMDVWIIDAQKQKRTPCDVRGAWVRPRCPSKTVGRKGTRRMWKRRNAPHYIMHYREPTDLVVIHNRVIIATPLQAEALRRMTVEKERAGESGR